uniref:Uncharacterized protein n=1 Tax=Cyprinus carpio carpio TaxID=630221 RepID=A0A8C1C314_CYPCA
MLLSEHSIHQTQHVPCAICSSSPLDLLMTFLSKGQSKKVQQFWKTSSVFIGGQVCNIGTKAKKKKERESFLYMILILFSCQCPKLTLTKQQEQCKY